MELPYEYVAKKNELYRAMKIFPADSIKKNRFIAASKAVQALGRRLKKAYFTQKLNECNTNNDK